MNRTLMEGKSLELQHVIQAVTDLFFPSETYGEDPTNFPIALFINVT